MSAASRLKYLYLAYLSQPKPDRVLYRMMRKRRIRRIVEIGIGSGQRSLRLIQVAQRYACGEPIYFTGIDLFEDRPTANPGVLLKSAFRALRSTRARVKLIPGNPFEALNQFSNMLAGTDLLLIAGDQDADALGRSWYYLPRMLNPDSLILREEIDGETTRWNVIPRLDIERRAQVAQRQVYRRAA